MTHPLTQFRTGRGQTLEAFGKEIGASKSMIWKWENGKAVPRRRYAEKLAAITDGKVTPNDFLLRPEACQ